MGLRKPGTRVLRLKGNRGRRPRGGGFGSRTRVLHTREPRLVFSLDLRRLDDRGAGGPSGQGRGPIHLCPKINAPLRAPSVATVQPPNTLPSHREPSRPHGTLSLQREYYTEHGIRAGTPTVGQTWTNGVCRVRPFLWTRVPEGTTNSRPEVGKDVLKPLYA